MLSELDLTVAVTFDGDDAAVLAPTGIIDFGSHQLLRDKAAEVLGQGRVRIVIDLTGVRICDSSGLSAMVAIHRQTIAAGGWLRLAAPRPIVVTALTVTGLDRLLRVFASAAEALEAS